MNIVQQFNPEGASDLSFQFDALANNLPDPVLNQIEAFNLIPRVGGTAVFIDNLRQKVVPKGKSGMQYAVLDENGSSTEMAVLHFNPNNHAFDENVGDRMLMRAEFMRRVIRDMGIRDEKGKVLPLIAFASPSGECSMPMSFTEWRYTLRGDFEFSSYSYLNVAQRLGFGRVAMIGHSQGGTLAAAAGSGAHWMNLDATHVAAGAPGNVIEDRGLMAFNKDFNSESGYQEMAQAAGIDLITETFDNFDSRRHNINFVRRLPTNLTLVKGMGHATLRRDIGVATRRGAAVTVVYSDRDKVAPKDAVEENIKTARLFVSDHQKPIEAFLLEGVGHAWGDHVPVWATIGAYALSR